MPDDIRSILSHVSVGTNDFERTIAFYDRAMPALGAKRIMAHPGAIAYGKQLPEFWVQRPFDGKQARVGNGAHIGFLATSKAQVDAFHAAALTASSAWCERRPDGEISRSRRDFEISYNSHFVNVERVTRRQGWGDGTVTRNTGRA